MPGLVVAAQRARARPCFEIEIFLGDFGAKGIGIGLVNKGFVERLDAPIIYTFARGLTAHNVCQ